MCFNTEVTLASDYMYVCSKNRLKIEAFFSAHSPSQSQEGPTVDGVPYIFPYHTNMGYSS